MSKAAQRRRRKAANASQVVQVAETHEQPVTVQHRRPDSNPTPERRARGSWRKPPKGEQGPMIDIASDMIGRLHNEGSLTTSQEQAARQFTALRSAYVAELDVSQHRSCLDNSGGGYDSGDGNPEAMSAYRSLENRIGRISTAILILETEKAPDDMPFDLPSLRNALNCMAA